jgi:hypothetical protein
MHKTQKSFEVFLFVIQDEVVRAFVHPLQYAIGISDDRHPLPPCQRRRKKSRYLYILFLREPMRYLYRIIVYKERLVILLVFLLE